MVRFSDLKKHQKGAAAPLSGSSADGKKPLAIPAANGSEIGDGAYGGESPADWEGFFKDAFFYLGKVFAAVRERKRIALDPGFHIIRRLVESRASKDTLFVKTIQLGDRRNHLIQKSINVAVYSVRLADELGYSGEEQVELGMAGLLHEVGMCLIPEKVLYKKGQLTQKEQEMIRQHSELGYKILEPYSDSCPYLAEVALQAHERIDGSGYPKGLTGDEIHEYGQIVGLVDIYEALTHPRPQREPFNHFYAIKEMIKTGKSKFDKKHLKALINAFSLFPLSTCVRLNSNAVGRVIETFRDQPMRPKLQIEYDSQGRKVLTERIVNLPENSLLYIVDSISEEEIAQLEHGLPFEKKQDPVEVQDDGPRAGVQSGPNPGKPATPASRSTSRTAGTRGGGGGRPLLGLLLLLLFLGGFFFLKAMAPAGSSAIEQVETTPAPRAGVLPAAEEKKNAAATAGKSERTTVPPPGQQLHEKEILGNYKPEQPADPGPRREVVSEKAESTGIAPAAAQPEMMQRSDSPDPTGDKRGASPRANEANSGETLQRTDPLKALKMRRAGRFPYALLLSSFRTLARAERAVAIYRERGIDPYPVEVDLGDKGTWYRVFSGCYATAAEAASAAETLAVKKVAVKHTRYANLIGIDLSDKEVRKRKLHLEALGFLPYTIPTVAGQADLFVGAFLTQEGAEVQHAKLQVRGVKSRIVER